MMALLFSPFLEHHREAGTLVFRLGVAFVLVYGTLVYGTADNVLSHDRMVKFRDFLAERGTPFPLFSALVLLLGLAACDTADPVSPPENGPFAAVVLDDTASPEMPPSSINQAVTVELRLSNDYGEAVQIGHSCGSVLADVQKVEGTAWRTVGTTGCSEESEPLVVADGDSTEVTALFYVGGLDVDDLAGSYRLVLHVNEEESGALPDSMRTTNAFEVEESALIPAPEVFAPGIVSTEAEEYRITFTPDGSRAYFARSDAFFPFSRQATIYETRREGGAWTAPVVASFSGTYPDIDPFVTPDGGRLYFSSIRPVNGAARTDVDVWYVAWTGNGWGEPQHAGAVNSPSDELYPSVAANGTLYVGSDRPGGLGGWDIYRASPAGDSHGTAENVGAPVNTTRWEFNPVVSPDGQTLVYTGLSYPGGVGFGDLYTSVREGSAWGAPEGIGSVNTALDEFHASRSPDGRLLFFVRRDPNASGADGNLHVVSWSPTP